MCTREYCGWDSRALFSRARQTVSQSSDGRMRCKLWVKCCLLNVEKGCFLVVVFCASMYEGRMVWEKDIFGLRSVSVRWMSSMISSYNGYSPTSADDGNLQGEMLI